MFNIGDYKLGKAYKPFIIAELSANHNGSLATAKQTILEAKRSGADAVKIQSYTADTMTIESSLPDFLIKEGPWSGNTLYELYREASTPFNWHKALFDYAREIDLIIFSSPFDETAVDLLRSLNTPAYKIASFEIVDLPLIEYVAKVKKPMLISTGMASEQEIGDALELAKKYGTGEVLLFHCISGYPVPIEQSNLANLNYLKKHFEVEVGLSDHTLGITAAVTAIGLGAVAIEKHFTLDRTQKGPDSAFSLEPVELKNLVNETAAAWSAIGQGGLQRSKVEEQNKIFRRSIYFVKDLEKGDLITNDAIRRIRPGFGLSPKYFDELLGKPVLKDVFRGEPVSWEAIRKIQKNEIDLCSFL